MTWTRRHLLQLGGAAIAAGTLPSLAGSATREQKVIKPKVSRRATSSG